MNAKKQIASVLLEFFITQKKKKNDSYFVYIDFLRYGIDNCSDFQDPFQEVGFDGVGLGKAGSWSDHGKEINEFLF